MMLKIIVFLSIYMSSLAIEDGDAQFKLPFFWEDVETKVQTLGVLELSISTSEQAQEEVSSLGVPPVMVRDAVEARENRRRTVCSNYQIPMEATNSFQVAQQSIHERSRRGDSGDMLRQILSFDDFFQLGKDLQLTGTWVELGVCQGKQSVKFLDNGPQSKLLMVDLWGPVDAYTSVDGEDNFAETVKNLAGYDPSLYHVFKMTTNEASTRVEDGSLDFIYLDAGHMYKDVMEDLKHWWPKLKKGGVFAGDDYFNGFVPQAGYTFGVRDAVDEFFGTKNYRVQATGYAFPKEGVFQQWYVLKCEI